MARLNWCLAAVISWGKFLFACFFPLRGAKRDKPDELEGVHTHTFKLKPFKKAKSSEICKQAITKEGLICKACRLSCHKKCEVKVEACWDRGVVAGILPEIWLDTQVVGWRQRLLC
ncbi:tensin-like isoform X1 [Lates japonicus]|uniref:Tensin-like isoform X1 n=1 Tax=Lates japonicus TaxID=270547 RepID=A0AAD3NMQ8_LATJO|nr:tensin-like isoform X1 [Lates japonicus]